MVHLGCFRFLLQGHDGKPAGLSCQIHVGAKARLFLGWVTVLYCQKAQKTALKAAHETQFLF